MTSPLDVRCPTCASGIREPCVGMPGDMHHATRVKMATELDPPPFIRSWVIDGEPVYRDCASCDRHNMCEEPCFWKTMETMK